MSSLISWDAIKQVARLKEKAGGQVSNSNSDVIPPMYKSATLSFDDEKKATMDANSSWNSQIFKW
jgi:hypothetical protein